MVMRPPPKRRRLSPPRERRAPRPNPTNGDPEDSSAEEEDGDDLTILQDSNSFTKSASNWDLEEQAYERRARKHGKEKENLRLPIKTADGRLEDVPVSLPQKDDGHESDDSFASVPTDTPDTEIGNEDAERSSEPETRQSQSSRRDQIFEAQEELARIASLINEDPEEHIGALKTLTQITMSPLPEVTKLGLATQLAVYKDVIPGYRIRPLPQEELGPKISKEVRQLRNFEQTIVRGYQAYVQELSRLVKLERASKKGEKMGPQKKLSQDEMKGLITVATSCACNLLTSVPHFNLRSDLLKILIDRLSDRRPKAGEDPNFQTCAQALEQLFAEDDEGNASLEAVTMLSKMIKAREYRVNEGVVNVFLHLRLLSEFSQKASTERIDGSGSKEKSKKLKGKGEREPLNQIKKRDREFRTKRLRKTLKERKAIEKEMKEADAIVTHEERDKKQAETLKLVFGIYFRILKARVPNLMGATLEGLVQYAHLINQEFFGDLLESLKDLIGEINAQERETQHEGEEGLENDAEDDNDAPIGIARNTTLESLLCIITAFGLLQGQDAASAANSLGLDLNFFVNHLYRTLHPLALTADIEKSSSASKSKSTGKSKTVDHSTPSTLLLRSLSAALLPAKTATVPPTRLAAFLKQTLTGSLHSPEKTATALQSLMQQAIKKHGKRAGLRSMFRTEERRNDGMHDGATGDPEGSNPFAATVWEGELLRLHFCPEVREGWKGMENMAAGL
ncbi:MAG: hypothetical protein M1831_002218 [Alyxoria varia]|nr:MAG: hypothetical protein M1831_002218 [Alyxoria varia]